MKIRTAACSEIGLRDTQQDRYCHFYIDNKTVLVVDDGNGGEGGDMIAEAAIMSVCSELCFKLSQCKKGVMTEDQLKELGINAINNAAVHVLNLKKSHQEWNGAGTTLTILIATEDKIACFWVGDSCAYIFQDDEFIKLTSPVHTLAEDLIKGGESKEIIAKQPSLNNILTNCVGHEPCVPDSKIIEITKPCIALAGSDGVFGFLPEEKLKEIIKAKFTVNYELQDLTDEIVKLSLENGSDDNVTLVLSVINPSQKLQERSRRLTKIHEWNSSKY